MLWSVIAGISGALVYKDSLPRNSCFDVCEQLLVSEHHLLEVAEPEVDLDHLLEGLEAPLPLLPVLQVQDPLEAVKCSLSDSASHLLPVFRIRIRIRRIRIFIGPLDPDPYLQKLKGRKTFFFQFDFCWYLEDQRRK
jgi:hypothetical protein